MDAEAYLLDQLDDIDRAHHEKHWPKDGPLWNAARH